MRVHARMTLMPLVSGIALWYGVAAGLPGMCTHGEGSKIRVPEDKQVICLGKQEEVMV